MRKIKLILALLLTQACSSEKQKFISSEVIDGKVSAVLRYDYTGSYSIPPVIWVQDSKNTRAVDLPVELDGRWNVGDSCLLIIEKYKEVE